MFLNIYTFMQSYVLCVKHQSPLVVFTAQHFHMGADQSSPLPGVFAKVPCQLVGQGSSPLSRVTTVLDPLHGECQEFHDICI